MEEPKDQRSQASLNDRLAHAYEVASLWLSFWLARIFLHRLRHTHPWYYEGKWGIPFSKWCSGATPTLREYSVAMLTTFIALILVLIRLATM
jgi:hypothetical protein